MYVFYFLYVIWNNCWGLQMFEFVKWEYQTLLCPVSYLHSGSFISIMSNDGNEWATCLHVISNPFFLYIYIFCLSFLILHSKISVFVIALHLSASLSVKKCQHIYFLNWHYSLFRIVLKNVKQNYLSPSVNFSCFHDT